MQLLSLDLSTYDDIVGSIKHYNFFVTSDRMLESCGDIIHPGLTPFVIGTLAPTDVCENE